VINAVRISDVSDQMIEHAESIVRELRNQRDIVLYADKTGLVDIASDVKLYVKSAYGATSPLFRSVSGLAFSKLN